MRLLLDTHALLWALSEPAKLTTLVRNRIASRGNELLVSAASAWEIGTKVRLGKLPGHDAIVQNLPHLVERLGAAPLPITQEHALYAGTLSWGHRDPFDRMLAAQSILDDASLVTKDPVFDGLSAVHTLW